MADRPAIGHWHEQPLSRRHDRISFDCGEASLNDYLRRFARQNHESGGSKCFVAVPADAVEPVSILGYYTLSPGEIEFDRVPRGAKAGLGRYGVPVYRLGRLAVDARHQGLGLGHQLLLSAGERALAVAAAVGGVALAIDAKSDRAAAWYASFGALPLLDDPSRLVLPLATIAAALSDRRAARVPDARARRGE